MKKAFLYILFIAVGSYGVYYGLTKFNNKSSNKTKDMVAASSKQEIDDTNNGVNGEIVPSRDGFISEAIKLQTLAENQEGNDTCVCYDVKSLDRNTSLSGSILVYTIDDLFVSTMWLSNGHYILNGVDNASTELLEDSSEQASLYCGEMSSSQEYKLCATNY